MGMLEDDLSQFPPDYAVAADIMPPSSELGTDPHKIRRNDGPSTSESAAHAVDTASGEAKVLEIISEFGPAGCILDELKDEFRRRHGLDEQFVNRRTGLHDKGAVLVTNITKKGRSKQPQHVYVARHLIEEKWVVWLKENYGWLNPCLFAKGEEIPLNPSSTRAIMRDLLEELVSANLEIMMEGGVYTSSIGESLDHEDSAIGRACAYLKIAIPVVPEHGESPWRK